MSNQVVNGAQLMCSFGMASSSLQILPANKSKSENQNAATVMDFQPMTNIQPFGMCVSLCNPQVAAATSAAMGVLTPQSCIPATCAPWTPGSPNVQIATYLALDDVSTCLCQWAGVITVIMPGTTARQTP